MKEQFDKEKFIELVLYIADSAKDDEDFGAVKMAKALWKADFQAFATLGRSITGAEYEKLEKGPGAREFKPVFQEMRKAGLAEREDRKVWRYDSWRVVPLKKPNMGRFSPEELEIIQKAVEWMRKKSATALSRESHGWGWEAVGWFETIPYGTELFPEKPLPISDIAREYGAQVARRLSANG